MHEFYSDHYFYHFLHFIKLGKKIELHFLTNN